MSDKITPLEAEAMVAKEAADHPIAKDLESLSRAGTMQLRTIGKIMRVKNYSTLKRDQLILAIAARKRELWQEQQQELWKE